MEAFLVECFLAVTLFLFGFVAAMGYEAFIILRMIIKHKRCFIAAQDIIYPMVVGYMWFMLIYRRSSGQIHFFYYLVTVIGVITYRKLFSKAIIGFVNGILDHIRKRKPKPIKK